MKKSAMTEVALNPKQLRERFFRLAPGAEVADELYETFVHECAETISYSAPYVEDAKEFEGQTQPSQPLTTRVLFLQSDQQRDGRAVASEWYFTATEDPSFTDDFGSEVEPHENESKIPFHWRSSTKSSWAGQRVSSDELNARASYLAELLRQMELSVTQAFSVSRLKSKILDIFETAGFDRQALEAAASIAAKREVDSKLERAWSEIPQYLDKKAECDGKWSPELHFDKYWREWVDLGVLYQDQLRKFDAPLVNAIRGWCKRHGGDPKKYLPPTKSQRIEYLAQNVDQLTGKEGMRLQRSLVKKAHRARHK